jgi:DNA-binding NarL/FixJ family response regulator
MPITVVLTDDKEVVRHSIRLLLSSESEIQIVGEATNYRQTIERVAELEPQIVILDMHMSDDSSVNPQEIKFLLKAFGTRLIAISFWDDEDTQALAERFGAVILLDKLKLATKLIPAIKAATVKQPSAGV